MMAMDKNEQYAIERSWDFIEYCEKKDFVRINSFEDEETKRTISRWRRYLPLFRREKKETCEQLKKRERENFVDCGFISDLRHSSGVYYFSLEASLGGMKMSIPDELFAGSDYRPNEGDRITFTEKTTFAEGSHGERRSTGDLTFYVRNNGQDRKIYSINENSEEYKSIMSAAQAKVANVSTRSSSSFELG